MTTHHFLVPRRSVLPSASRGWSDFDRLFDELWGGLASPRASQSWKPPVDVTETETEFRVAAELPGLEEKDIEVNLEDGVLTISGERVDEKDATDAKGVRHVETRRGSFRRSLRLPTEVDSEGVKAVYRRGILEVTLPKAPEAQARSIPITS